MMTQVQSRRKWWRVWLFVGLFGMLSMWHCSHEVKAPSDSCFGLSNKLQGEDTGPGRAFKQIRDTLSRQNVYGCLQVAYGDSATNLSQARATLVLYNDPNIFGDCGGGNFTCQVNLSLPRRVDGQFLRMRLFLTSLGTDDIDDARTLCENVARDPKFACVSHKDCLLAMEFQQSVDGYQSVPVTQMGQSTEMCALMYRGADAPSEPAPVDVDEPIGPEPLPDASEPPQEPISPEILPEPPEYGPEPPKPVCRDGEMRECYTGPSGSAGLGLCKKGQQICAGGVWGPCRGEVLPAKEICDDNDNDCDGLTDEDCHWLVGGGGVLMDQGLGIALDSQGKVLIAGSVTGASTGGTKVKLGSLQNQVTGVRHAYVARLDPNNGAAEFFTMPLIAGATGTPSESGASAAATAGDVILAAGYFGQSLNLSDGVAYKAMNPELNSAGKPSADGFIASLGQLGGWQEGQRIGGAGEDVISDMVCCREGVGGIKYAYALALIRANSATTQSFTSGRGAATTRHQFEKVAGPAFNDRLNTALVLLEIPVNTQRAPILSTPIPKQLALWEAMKTTLDVTITNEFPRLALFRHADPTKVSLFVAFSADLATGTGSSKEIFLIPRASTAISGVGHKGVLMRVDVDPTSTPQIQRRWYEVYQGGRVNLRNVAVRDAGGDALDVAVTGSFVGTLAVGVKVWNATGSDIFVVGMRDSKSAPALSSKTVVTGGGVGNDQGNAVGFDHKGNIYVAGYASVANVPPSLGPNVQGFSMNGRNLFYAKTDGRVWLWALGDGGQPPGADAAHGLVTDPMGSLFLIGSYSKKTFYGKSLEPTGHVLGDTSIFVAKNLNWLVPTFR